MIIVELASNEVPEPENLAEKNKTVGILVVCFKYGKYFLAPAELMIETIEDARSVHEKIEKYLEASDSNSFNVMGFWYPDKTSLEKFNEDIEVFAREIGAMRIM